MCYYRTRVESMTQYSDLEVTNLLTSDYQLLIKPLDTPVPDRTDGVLIYGKPGMQSGDDPLLYLSNASLVTDNDVMVYGSIAATCDWYRNKSTGGGAIIIGHGWTNAGDYPLLMLTDWPQGNTGTPYNKLLLKYSATCAKPTNGVSALDWGHLELGCLNANGYINVGTSKDGISRFITIQGPNASGQTATLNLESTYNYVKVTYGGNFSIGSYYGIDFYTNTSNNSSPTMNLSTNGTLSIYNSGVTKASIDNSGNMGIAGTLTINGNGVAAANVLPLSYNTGYVGTSSLYYAYMYMNNCYAKHGYNFGCEISKSGQIWERDFQTKTQAEEFLTHELTKERRHITYDLQNKGKIICTCGKSVDNPCPEHIEQWNDLYTINTTKLLEATSCLAFEMNSELAKLQNDNLKLNERGATIEKLLKEKQTAA
jgi:hypothetical protein